MIFVGDYIKGARDGKEGDEDGEGDREWWRELLIS
jgi:hypothetical protein